MSLNNERLKMDSNQNFKSSRAARLRRAQSSRSGELKFKAIGGKMADILGGLLHGSVRRIKTIPIQNKAL
jgi:hypothetical protein